MEFGRALNLFAGIQIFDFIKHRATLHKYFTKQNGIQKCKNFTVVLLD